MSTDDPGTGPQGSDAPPAQDLPADAASSGRPPADPENTHPTPGSDNDGVEAGYTPPSGT